MIIMMLQENKKHINGMNIKQCIKTLIVVLLICICTASCDNTEERKHIASLEEQLSAYKDSLKSSRMAFREISNSMYKLSIERAEILNRLCERLEVFDAAFNKIGLLYNDNEVCNMGRVCRQEREEYRECQNSWNDLANRAKFNLEKNGIE